MPFPVSGSAACISKSKKSFFLLAVSSEESSWLCLSLLDCRSSLLNSSRDFALLNKTFCWREGKRLKMGCFRNGNIAMIALMAEDRTEPAEACNTPVAAFTSGLSWLFWTFNWAPKATDPVFREKEDMNKNQKTKNYEKKGGGVGESALPITSRVSRPTKAWMFTLFPEEATSCNLCKKAPSCSFMWGIIFFICAALNVGDIVRLSRLLWISVRKRRTFYDIHKQTSIHPAQREAK